MAAAVDRLYDEGRTSVTGVVVASAKKTFFAGGNLKKMVQATPADAPRLRDGEAGQGRPAPARDVPRPVVAAINGAALGGGFEICLAANHRILVDDPKAEVGLPEATLGLLPGGGGVTRVVRLLGLQPALMDVLLPGTRFKPAGALEKGLVDEVVATREELVPAAKAWIRARQPRGRRRTPGTPGYKMPGGTPATPKLAAFLPAFPALLRKQTKGADYPAPAGDPLRRGRGRAGRLRHRLADRVALPDQPDRQPGLEEHDPGVLLRPAGDQRRQAAPARASRRTAPPRSASSAPG